MKNLMGRIDNGTGRARLSKTVNARLMLVGSGVPSTAPRLPRGFHGVPSYGRFDGKVLKIWSGRPGSNRRPTAWKAETLPLSYSRSNSNAFRFP